MRKGQTALEYLMTYGWAILIVIIVVAALYALGLTKPCRWQANPTISLPPDLTVDPGSVKVYNDAATGNTHVKFNIVNNKQPIDIDQDGGGALSLTMRGIDSTSYTLTEGGNIDFTWDVGELQQIDWDLGSKKVTPGDCYTVDVKLTYTIGGSTYTWSGTISGVVAG